MKRTKQTNRAKRTKPAKRRKQTSAMHAQTKSFGQSLLRVNSVCTSTQASAKCMVQVISQVLFYAACSCGYKFGAVLVEFAYVNWAHCLHISKFNLRHPQCANYVHPTDAQRSMIHGAMRHVSGKSHPADVAVPLVSGSL